MRVDGLHGQQQRAVGPLQRKIERILGQKNLFLRSGLRVAAVERLLPQGVRCRLDALRDLAIAVGQDGRYARPGVPQPVFSARAVLSCS